VALEVLQEAGYRTDGLRPKHWRDFTGPEAPVLDFVFTLSDTASRKVFPDWPGKPISAHWCYPDPVAVQRDEWQKRHEHGETLSALERQMRAFMMLSFASLDRIALKKRLYYGWRGPKKSSKVLKRIGSPSSFVKRANSHLSRGGPKTFLNMT
jgi:hypothetical protein